MSADFFGASMEALGQAPMTGTAEILIRVAEEIAGRGGKIGVLLSAPLFRAAVTAQSADGDPSVDGVVVQTFEGGGATCLLNDAAFGLSPDVTFDVVVLHDAASDAQKQSVRGLLRAPKVTWTTG